MSNAIEQFTTQIEASIAQMQKTLTAFDKLYDDVLDDDTTIPSDDSAYGFLIAYTDNMLVAAKMLQRAHMRLKRLELEN